MHGVINMTDQRNYSHWMVRELSNVRMAVFNEFIVSEVCMINARDGGTTDNHTYFMYILLGIH